MADVANEAMRQAWDGPEGENWAALADKFERARQAHRAALLSAAGLAAGEHVLDVGCGNGASTLEAGVAAAPGRVVGIDLSSAMLAKARARAAAAELSNVSFVQADAQVHVFEPGLFDVVISNSGAMFFDDQVAAFTNLHGALTPGGRIALFVWQGLDQNEWLIELRRALAVGRDLPAPPVGVPGPFGLADPEHVRDLLTRTGYSDIAIEDSRPPMLAGLDVESAFTFMSQESPARGMLADLDDAQRIEALDNLRAVVAEHATPDGVLFGTAGWLITARHSGRSSSD